MPHPHPFLTLSGVVTIWNSLVRKPVIARRNKSSLTSDSLLEPLTCILLKKSLSHKLSFLIMPFRTSAFFRLAANSRIQRLRDVSAWLKICRSTGWQTRCHREERAHQHLFSPWHPPSQVDTVTFAAQVNKATLGFVSGEEKELCVLLHSLLYVFPLGVKIGWWCRLWLDWQGCSYYIISVTGFSEVHATWATGNEQYEQASVVADVVMGAAFNWA